MQSLNLPSGSESSSRFPMSSGALRPQFAVVEDDSFMAQLVSDMLLSSVVGVEVFSGGAALLRSADLPHFKAFILDLSLPDIDGFEVMDALAARKIDAPIVLMSGHDSAILLAAKIYGTAIGLDVRGTLKKPFTQQDLFGVAQLAS